MSCPSQHLESHAITINSAFTLWVRQDPLILHVIISSMVATVVTHLCTVKTAKKVWDILKTMYVSRSRVRIMALKQHITTFRKGTQPMATYLQGIKAIVDKLSIIDRSLDNTDMVIHTLNGLSNDYKEIYAALCSMETPISYVELHEKHMDFESILSRETNYSTEPLVVIANATLHNKG
ncbi:PREDICTED: uncharacterized protein LOC109359746 [Lupinus angustifolius]|uniref:uncharacterized protein LOC109359746 n=1 Tax=Lupinus angustifolius TaxID=3871 RepID=UPI00092FA3C7|nr:PREDICTED: uncharacterized protein LOC109359746 [Lupinus angustifolius]